LMKKNHTVGLSAGIIEKCEKLPVSRSGAIAQALMNAMREPQLLAMAFQLRLSQTKKDEIVKVAYTRDTKLDEVLLQLSELTKLPGEQVIRLALEAYVNRL